jgi:hypothetical protein
MNDIFEQMVQKNFSEVAERLRKLERKAQLESTQDKAGNFTAGSVLFGSSTGIPTQDNANFFFDDTNNRLLIGTATTPAGGGKLVLRGTDSSFSAGPHIQTHGTGDVYPILQILSYTHDNVGLAFDAYYDGAWRSSDAGSNFWLYKTNDRLKFFADNGIAAGSGVTLTEIFSITPAGVSTFLGALSVTAGNIIATAGNIVSDGASAGLVFNDRTTASVWQWYGNTSARLYNGSADVIQVTTTGIMNFVGSARAINMNGSQVIIDRQTGWATATGTATRTTFATFAGQTISNPPTQAQVQAIDNHVKILSERMKALIDDLHATAGHGLIGT